MTPALIWSFTRQELIDRYAGSLLGFGWAFLQPLVTMLIFIVIFSQIMGARLAGTDSTYGYAIYLIAGMLPWIAFSNTLSRCATVFVDKKGVLSKVGLSLPTLPLFIVLTECLTYLIGFGLFMVFLLLIDSTPRPSLLLLPWVFLIQQMLALGLGLILAVLNVFLRDVREFVGLFLQVWFWLTPVVWVPQAVPAPLQQWLSVLNPVYPLITAYHGMFIAGSQPDYNGLTIAAVLAGITLSLAYVLVRRAEKDVRDFL